MDESDEFFIYFMIEYLLDIIRSKSTDGNLFFKIILGEK